MEDDHEERSDVDSISHVETLAIRLDGPDEDENEGFITKKVIELAQTALHVFVLDRVLIVHLFVLLVQQRMIRVVGKQNAHHESPIIQVGNARRLQVDQLCHVRLEEIEIG